MRITRIEIDNWMAYEGRQVVELPAGPIAVVARYTENPRRSNWAGKTALLEAIGWALHGVHRKRLDDAIIRYGCDSASVRVSFDTGLEIVRSRARGKATRVLVTNGERSAEGAAAQSEIDAAIKMTAADLDATTWFKQGDAEAIVGVTSGKRRAIIGRWLELDAWERAHADAKAAVNSAAMTVAAASRVVNELTAAMRDAAQLEALTAERAELVARSMDVATWREKVKSARSILSEEERAASREEAARAAADRARSAREALQRLSKPDVDIDALRLKRADSASYAKAARDEERAARALLSGEFDGRCPVMHEECPAAAVVRGAGDGARRRLATAREAVAQLEAIEREIGEELRAAESISSQHAAAVQRYNAAIEEARRARKQLDEIESPAEEEVAEALRVLDEDARVQDAQREQARRLGEIDAIFREDADRTKRLASARTHEEVAMREHTIAVLVARAFAPSGIPARIAAEQLVGLEERANALLSGSGLSFSFGWERELRDLAPLCDECGYTYRGQREKSCPKCGAARAMKRTDELEILVDDGSGEAEDVSAKSGGAKVLIAAAIRLAGGMMLRELRGSPVTWAIVDEPFGFLDSENREALARTFAGMLGAVGLDQAFVVSHDAALLEAMPSKLVITRDGDASRMEVEA